MQGIYAALEDEIVNLLAQACHDGCRLEIVWITLQLGTVPNEHGQLIHHGNLRLEIVVPNDESENSAPDDD